MFNPHSSHVGFLASKYKIPATVAASVVTSTGGRAEAALLEHMHKQVEAPRHGQGDSGSSSTAGVRHK